ncbi:MAG: HNH endonuclease domain-containing protein, partial [Candidatus Pacearchaeota archaeon]
KDKKNQKKILDYFIKKQNSTILDFFFSHDPEITIPPYEDQNNRNVVHCQSLLLDAKKMDNQFGEIWRKIANKLGRDGANNVLDSYDASSIKAVHEELKKSLLGGINKKDIPFDEDSILMQRILEESNSASMYRLRLIIKEEKEIKGNKIQKLYKEAIENIKASLSEEEIKTLKKIAKRFYEDIEAARLGIWDEENSLLSKCNSKTTHKNKTQRLQVEQILRIQFKDDAQYEKFLEEVWEQQVKGKSTVKSICANIEDTRKSYGNLFKIEYEKVNRSYQQEEGLVPSEEDKKSHKKQSQKAKTAKSEQPLTAEQKEFLPILQNVKLISEKIFSWLKENKLLPEKYLETDQSPIKRTLPFANPFSLAQLYNILETERHGFNKLCKACIIENSWRSRQTESREKEKEMVDRGVRLSADTGRPFDGQIDKLLTRLGWEIAQAKVKQIEKNFQDGDSLKIPILMEFNQFNFTEEAYTLKKTGKNSKQWKRLNIKIEKSDQRLKAKEERIKNDSEEICAYTGKSIKDGEIDHILPRSYSLDNFGTVLNSEINLLYVSRAGNQEKGNQDYSIENIHNNFLKHHFGTIDRNQLKKQIEEFLNKTTAENQKKKIDYLQVESLEPQERLLLKMGLFYSDLREMILSKIQTHSRTLANGTQVWLFKRLRQSLKNLLSKKFPKSTIKIFPHYIGTSEDEFSLKKLRDMLADYDTAYKKNNDEEGQKETSHIIDASLVFAKAILDGKLNLKTPLITDEATPEWLESILPENLEIIPITSKPTYRKSRPYTTPLFKSGMYAERFLSLLIFKEEVKVGFTPELSYPLEMEVAQELFERLKPFLKKGKDFVDKDLTYYQNLETPMRYVLLKIDRQKAKEYLHTCKSDDLVGKTLEGLRYVQQNTDIIKKENNKNKFAVNLENDEEETQEEDSEDLQEGNEKKKNSKSKNKFSNVFSIPDIQQGKSKNIEFTLNLPFKKEWEEIYKKLKGIDLKDIEKARKIAHEFFHPEKSINNPYNHKTHPRKFSLPLKNYPPSGGFRILRHAPFGDKVFQVHTTEGHYMGFAIENGMVNFNKSVINPLFLQESISIYEFESKQDEIISQTQIAMFDEWRELPLLEDWKKEGICAVYVKLATQDRRDVKIVVDSSKLFGSKPNKAQLYETKNTFQFIWKDSKQEDDNYTNKIKDIINTIKIISKTKDKKTKEPFPLAQKIGIRVIEKAREKGAILRPLGPVIVLMPPLAIKERELSQLLDITYASIAEATIKN